MRLADKIGHDRGIRRRVSLLLTPDSRVELTPSVDIATHRDGTDESTDGRTTEPSTEGLI